MSEFSKRGAESTFEPLPQVPVGSVYYRQAEILSVDDERRLFGLLQVGQKAQEHLDTPGYDETSPYQLKRQIAAAKKAEEKIITSNLGLATWYARRYPEALPVVEEDDLAQEARLGVMDAVDDFNPTRGFRFSTHAIPKMRSRITRTIYQNSHVAGGFRVPPAIGMELQGYNRTIERLQQQFQREPTVAEIATDVDVNVNRVRQMHGAFHTIPLDSGRGFGTNREYSDTDGRPRLKTDPVELLEDPYSEDDILDGIQDEEMYRVLIEENPHLDERERIVIELHLGFDTPEGEELTLQEIGVRLGITRERVRQLEVKGLEKIRSYAWQGRHNFSRITPSDEDLDAWAGQVQRRLNWENREKRRQEEEQIRQQKIQEIAKTLGETGMQWSDRLGRVGYHELTEVEKAQLRILVDSYHEEGHAAEKLLDSPFQMRANQVVLYETVAKVLPTTDIYAFKQQLDETMRTFGSIDPTMQAKIRCDATLNPDVQQRLSELTQLPPRKANHLVHEALHGLRKATKTPDAFVSILHQIDDVAKSLGHETSIRLLQNFGTDKS